MTRTDDMKETELVRLVRGGDPSAARELYASHAGYLKAVAARYLADDEELRDVLQESFVRIFEAIGRFEYRGKGSLRAWMTRITVNEALKSLKRRGRLETLRMEYDPPDTGADDDPPLADIPQAAVQQMIRELPAGYRTVFNLYVFERKSHREIARMLGIGESSSASQLHRAKNMLAKRIREYEQNKRMTIWTKNG